MPTTAYTLSDIKAKAATVCAAKNFDFYFGEFDVNADISRSTKGKMIVMLFPEQCDINMKYEEDYQVQFWYFETFKTSTESRDAVAGIESAKAGMLSFLKSFVDRTNIINIRPGQQFPLRNFGYNLDKNKSICCSCTLNIRVFNK